MAKNKYFREKQKFIQRIVSPETLVWPREMKIANKLWAEYPSPEFWLTFILTFKLKSLAWLIGDGKVELNNQWNYFKLDKARKTASIVSPQTYNGPVLENTLPEELKPKTMKDWMTKSK